MSLDRVRQQQGYARHKFHCYRNGLPGYDATDREIRDGAAAGDPVHVQSLADITQRIASLPGQPGAVIPPAASFQFTTNHRDRLRNVAVPRRTHFNTLQNPLGSRELGREARDVVQQEYTKAYRAMRASFRYFKCLGWGGDGIVSLWRYSPAPRQEHLVVMKMSNNWEYAAPTGNRARVDTEYLDKERQIITVSDYPLPAGPRMLMETMLISNSDEHRT